MFFFNNTNDTKEDDKKVVEYGQVEYGKVPFITFICVILSKLAYLPDCGFLPRYEQIFGQTKIANLSKYCNYEQPFIKLDDVIEYNPIPASIFKAIKDANIEDIFKDQKIFKNCQDITFYTDSASNEKFVDFIKYAEFFNILNGSTNKRKTKGQEGQEGQEGGVSKNEYVQYISLAWSNYSMIYVVADKRSNTIFIVYRGTASFKGITSYVNFNTFNKNGPCDSDEAFIPGIFKITTEAIHTLLESVSYLATHFLKATINNSVKVLVTGHSLGGAMASIFAYLYTGIRNSNINSLSVLSKQIVCISIGAPRCINDATLKQYNHFINQNLIMYRRLVTKGDPVPQMPHKAYFGYHHPGDKLKTKNGLVFCQSTYSGLYGNFIDYDKSSNCKSKEDGIGSIRSFISQHNEYDHMNYLYVSYLSLVPVGFKTNEIYREPGSDDTVMRIVLGSKYDTKVAFFNLVKSRGANYKKPLLKFLVDVHNQDILMTHKAFLKLISLMKTNNNDNLRIKTILNEEIFDTEDEAPNLNCFTTYFKGYNKVNNKTRRLIRNKKGTRKKRM